MNYAETINYLFTKLPMFSRIGTAAYKKDLTNIKLLCEHLGNPHEKFKSIHIAGTNGKGSVSHMLAAILQTAGYKTGLCTSPHLYDFRERLKVNGELADEAFVVDFVERLQLVINEIEPSFFEISIAMAFDYFARQKVEIAVIEVGLGGRLDSTNIITPELSVITNIGLDHTYLLGSTLEEIAREKAGIIKENIPVVIGESQKEIATVFIKKATEKKAPVFFAEDFFSIPQWKLNRFLNVSIAKKSSGDITNYKLDLPGIYQIKNILTTLQAIAILQKKGFHISDSHVKIALQNVKGLTGLYGRWEVIHHDPMIVLEVAHNIDGITQMLAHINQLPFNKLHIVFGMANDKDTGVLHLLPKEAAYYFTHAHIPRALPVAELRKAASKLNLKGEPFDLVNEALQNAKENALKNDIIIVCGSIFLVAEVDKLRFSK
ncbi:MAG: bifunctional folylpolyglutamate synthase/dihydrofolate synthase [Bacteroidota bacterium]|nr:bifunctional folylpolyglutamate synthase/dihydrofolate synthase [Bacteroidota bacterium]